MMRLLILLAVLPGCLKQAEQRALSEPDNAESWERLGNVYRLHLQRQRAADAYREALRIDPERDYLSRRLPGIKREEVRVLRRDAMASPNDDELWGDLGDMLAYQGDRLAARQAYMRAFRLDPADAEWHTALIDLGAGEVLLESAQSSLDESDDESLGDVADLLAALGRTDEACDYWERAAAIDPSDGEWAGHAQACGYEVAEAPEGPVATFSDVPNESPTADDISAMEEARDADADLLYRLATAYHRTNDAKAVPTMWSALLINPNHQQMLHAYLVMSGSPLRRTLERLSQAHPDDDELLGSLADHYLSLGMHSRARATYQSALELDPDDSEWKAKLALFD